MRAKSANPNNCAAPFLSPAVVNLRWYYYIILHYKSLTHEGPKRFARNSKIITTET